VRLQDCASRTKEVQVAYCPAGGNCDPPVPMPPVGGSSNVFEHTFSWRDGVAEPPALHGYIYARTLDTHEETAVWYQIGGGVGPAYGDGHAPLVDAAVDASIAPGQPQPAHDTRLLFSPSPGCPNGGLQALPGIQGIIGTPFNVQPVVANGNGGHAWNVDDPQLQVRLGYSQDLLDRLGINESQLVVLRLEKGSRWQLVPTVARSRTLDWIAAAARPFEGQGVIYALGYRRPMWLPLIKR
jgi:hypothetical protein